MRIREFARHSVTVTEPIIVNAYMKEKEYLCSLDADKLLAGFRETAGLPKKADKYSDGWENEEYCGHTLGHYMVALAQVYAKEKSGEIEERLQYILSELSQCQKESGYLFTSDPEVFEKLEQGGVYKCWYTMHKIVTGLIAVYKLAGMEQALAIVKKLGGWIVDRVLNWTDKERRKVLCIADGGMNDCLYELYKITGEDCYAEAAEKFDEADLFTSLAMGKDVLPNKHAADTISKILGALNRYIAFGESQVRSLETAKNFFDMVVTGHTYVTGGNGELEHFRTAGDVAAERTQYNCETCSTYGMMNLAERLYSVTGDKRYMDYYERAYFNAMLGAQNPEDGMTAFFQPMATGYFKTFSDPYSKFWCCTGTGMEMYTDLSKSIYHASGGIYVNLYISSVLEDRALGVKLTQTVDPESYESAEFVLVTEDLKETSLYFRVPEWCGEDIEMSVNGMTVKTSVKNGYLSTESKRKSGDRIVLKFHPKVTLNKLPDTENCVALTYGPFVLAAGLGREDMTPERLQRTNVIVSTKNVSVHERFLLQEGLKLSEWFENCTDNIVKKDGELAFTVRGIDADEELVFRPYYKIYNERYGIYFDYYDEENLPEDIRALIEEQKRLEEERKAAEAARLAEEERRHLEEEERQQEAEECLHQEEEERLRPEEEIQRLEEEERRRQEEAAEAERQRQEAEEAEHRRQEEAAEAERQRQEAEEAERRRQEEAAEAERQRQEAEEAERRLQEEAAEAERQRQEAEEAERRRLEAEQRQRREEEEAKRKRLEAEEEETRRIETEARRIAAQNVADAELAAELAEAKLREEEAGLQAAKLAAERAEVEARQAAAQKVADAEHAAALAEAKLREEEAGLQAAKLAAERAEAEAEAQKAEAEATRLRREAEEEERLRLAAEEEAERVRLEKEAEERRKKEEEERRLAEEEAERLRLIEEAEEQRRMEAEARQIAAQKVADAERAAELAEAEARQAAAQNVADAERAAELAEAKRKEEEENLQAAKLAAERAEIEATTQKAEAEAEAAKTMKAEEVLKQEKAQKESERVQKATEKAAEKAADKEKKKAIKKRRKKQRRAYRDFSALKLILWIVGVLALVVVLYLFATPISKGFLKGKNAVDTFVAEKLPKVADVLKVKGHGYDLPIFKEDSVYLTEDAEDYVKTTVWPQGYSASVVRIDGKQYICIEGHGLKMFYLSELYGTDSKHVYLEKGEAKAMYFKEYSFDDPASLCPASGMFNTAGVKQYIFPATELNEMQILDATTLKECTVALQAEAMEDVLKLSECNEEGQYVRINMTSGEVPYAFWVLKKGGLNLADGYNFVLDNIRYEIGYKKIDFEAYVTAAGQYLGKVTGRLDYAMGRYVPAEVTFYAFADEDFVNKEAEVITATHYKGAEVERVEIAGENGERLLVPAEAVKKE